MEGIFFSRASRITFPLLGLGIFFVATNTLGTTMSTRRTSMATLRNATRPNLHFLVTTCLEAGSRDYLRQFQYERGIGSLFRQIKKLELSHFTVTLVDCGPSRPTFLDRFKQVDVIYTNTNAKPDIEKGVREIWAVKSVIRQKRLRTFDLVVKMTGRYYFAETSPFMEQLARLDRRVGHAAAVPPVGLLLEC